MESRFRQDVRSHLSTYFDFFPEVKGTHFSGKRLSIDHIIKPKDVTQWKNKEVVFGLEYKDLNRIDGDTTNYTSWLAQCVDYANTKWDGYGYFYVLTCPGIRSTEFIKQIDSDWLFARVMGHLGIGELKIFESYGWTITLQDSHRIWSERNGVECGKFWSLIRKFGSR